MNAARLPPEIVQAWQDGCAIVSFGLNSDGKIVAPRIELEKPEASGVGALAIAYLQQNVYAPATDRFHPLGVAPADWRFAMTIGFVHNHGRRRIEARTVVPTR